MIATISKMDEHQRQSLAAACILALCLGLVVGFGFRGAIEPDARSQALDWFYSQPHDEQAAFVYVQLGDDKKRQWIAHRWCSLNPGDDWACGKAGMGSPVYGKEPK